MEILYNIEKCKGIIPKNYVTMSFPCPDNCGTHTIVVQIRGDRSFFKEGKERQFPCGLKILETEDMVYRI